MTVIGMVMVMVMVMVFLACENLRNDRTLLGESLALVASLPLLYQACSSCPLALPLPQ